MFSIGFSAIPQKLGLTPSAIPYPSYFESRVMTRKYDTTGSGHLPGRNIGYTLSGASGSGTDNEVSYGYDTKGRFDAVATPSSGPAFTYSFAPNSNLVGSISETSGWTETNTFEADRNLLSRIAGQFSTPVKAQFDYTHDDLGRRLTATDSGEIFARYNGGAITTHYGPSWKGSGRVFVGSVVMCSRAA